MRNFAFKLSLTDGTVVHATGFDGGVEAEPELRLLVATRIEVGGREFFVSGVWYSMRSAADLEQWLGRYTPDRVGDWAQEHDGDFQVVVVDRAARNVVLVGDRNGPRRTYYAVDDGHAVLAARRSDIVGLLSRPALCPYSAYQLLTLGYVLDPYSLLDGVRTTHPGQIVTLDARGARVEEYYAPVQHDAEYYRSEAECLAGLDAAAERVFRKRLGATRTPVVLLSGGIDSMAMLVYLNRIAPGKVRTVTFSVTGLERNELAPARKVAEHFRSDHYELHIDPTDGGRLLARTFLEADTWNYAAFFGLAEREYLEECGEKCDVFSGQDTRLHTPSFDAPREMGIRLNRGGAWRLGRPVAAVAGRAMAVLPFSGSLKNYSDYWSHHLRPRVDFPTYFLEGLLGHQMPSGQSATHGGFQDRLRDDLPRLGPRDDLQTVFKKYVAFEYRAQYTDDMNCVGSCFPDDGVSLHFPFYDWGLVDACNRVPYSLGARRIFTLKSHNKLPVVQKYVLRQLLRDHLPDDSLYRYKCTVPALYGFFNHSLRPFVSALLDRWYPELKNALGPELSAIMDGYVAEFRAKSVYARNVDEWTLGAVLAICYLGMLQRLCTHLGTSVEGELAGAADRAAAATAAGGVR